MEIHDGVKGSIRLVDSSSAVSSSYVALSYCWGGNITMKCTTSNINDLRNGVNLTELPRTIREAINLTTKLALKYIWVDVLCIIQDDKSDWEREAKKMGTIYENAYLTVAAACSSSSEQGFMLPQTEKMPFRVNLCDSNGNPVVIGMRKILRCGIHGSRSDPWHHRGWTLQEGLLSTRLVSYTSKEIQ